jgi:hypothetical protein
MKDMDIDPIHVVAAMETETTTAIRIIEAITGLNALLALRNFSIFHTI